MRRNREVFLRAGVPAGKVNVLGDSLSGMVLAKMRLNRLEEAKNRLEGEKAKVVGSYAKLMLIDSVWSNGLHDADCRTACAPIDGKLDLITRQINETQSAAGADETFFSNSRSKLMKNTGDSSFGAITLQFELRARKLDDLRETALTIGVAAIAAAGVGAIAGIPLAVGAVAAATAVLSAVAYVRAGKAEKIIVAAGEFFRKSVVKVALPSSGEVSAPATEF